MGWGRVLKPSNHTVYPVTKLVTTILAWPWPQWQYQWLRSIRLVPAPFYLVGRGYSRVYLFHSVSRRAPTIVENTSTIGKHCSSSHNGCRKSFYLTPPPKKSGASLSVGYEVFLHMLCVKRFDRMAVWGGGGCLFVVGTPKGARSALVC